MSFGDEIMALGQAQRHFRATGRRAVIVDLNGRPRWSPVWDGEPAIVRKPGPGVDAIPNGPQCRPYLERIDREQAVFSDWRARDHRAELRLAPAEIRAAEELTAGLGPFVALEPTVTGDNPNKQWGASRWAALAAVLAERLPDLAIVQLSPPGSPPLPGARPLLVEGFRRACAVLARARAAVLPEGGLHHAAAALHWMPEGRPVRPRRSVPAVVIFGGFVSPETTGYPEQIALTAGGEPCGRRKACPHCRDAMARIAPAAVADAAMRRIAETEAQIVSRAPKRSPMADPANPHGLAADMNG